MAGLTRGQNYTSSVKANALELMEVLSFELFERIDKVRGVRNKVIHKRQQCSLEEAAMAMNVVSEIVGQKSGVEIRLDLSQATST